MKQAQVEFEHCSDGKSGCCVSESFVVSDVTNILLSFGRMLKTGWTFGEVRPGDMELVSRLGHSCAGVLMSPDGEFRIPVFFRKNSLSVLAHVRRASEQMIPPTFSGQVRGVYVKLNLDVSALKDGWSFLENGNPVHKQHGKTFVDPGEALSRTTWRFRTTIVLLGPVWEVVEHSKEIALISDLGGDIPGILIPTTVLTFPQRHISPLSDCLCELLTDEQLPEVMEESEKIEIKEKGIDLFGKEPSVPEELHDLDMLEPGGFAGGHEEQPESVWVNGRELTKESKVKDLQEACNFYGINASGSKSKLYDRLCSYVTKQFQKDVDRAKNNLQKLEMGPQANIPTKGTERPTDPKVIDRHEATHLPFAPSCEACLKTKSKEDKTLTNTDASVDDTGTPHIQLDWMYLGRNCPSLVMLDTTTRYGAIFPARTKGAWKALAEFCVKFSLGLNHVGDVVFVMDSEPATLGLLDMIVMIRQEMGYRASKKIGKPYHKGRTARVERYIQTVRRQANTLMASVESNIHELLDDLHCLRAWALVHAVFLLNRFHEHSGIKATAFETVFGHKYNGKILPFGEFVFGLRQPLKKRGTSVWQGGIWIGKDEADMHVLVTAGGQIHCRSIRRCGHAWRPDVIKSLTSSPWTKMKGSGPVGLLEAPLPSIEEKPEGSKRDPILLGSGFVDEEAEEVLEHANSYEPTEPGSPQEEEQVPTAMASEPLERLSDVQRKSLLGIPIIPTTPEQIDVDQEGAPAEKREANESPEERQKKAARFENFDRAPSPSSSPKESLFAPLFAGNVNAADRPHGDLCWESEVDWEVIDKELETMEVDFHGDRPPDISTSELQQLDSEAMRVEVEKLTGLGVVKVVLRHNMDAQGKWIDLKEVFDWRFRQGAWKRRCRIVAREFKTGPSTEETFSPTSSHGVVRLFLLCHLCFGWKLASLDISDAYLTVEQKEICYVEISQWMKEQLKLPDDAIWELRKVLPGQRNGAQRWFQDFTKNLHKLGFHSCTAMPSVLKHNTRKMAINVHVDDELIAAENKEDVEWLVKELEKHYKLQAEGPFPIEALGSNEELNYLKKVYVFKEDGIYVKPNRKFTETLVHLYHLQERKEKQVPEHSLLTQPDTSADLDDQRQSAFRTALGTAMYMSHERWDIQYCVKSLASFMRNPTEHAERCLIQLLLYLKGTADLSFRMLYTPVGSRMATKLNHVLDLEPDEDHVMEVFCDSDWAGGPARKSTTSVMILLNSLPILSYSRTQKAVSLSSCEAEVLALTSGSSEALLLKEVWQFMTGQKVTLEARSDSSSGRQWLQRSGLGRLKHIDVRLCWLQEAIRGQVLRALPISTQVNIANLNTKKLTASRRRFLLSFLGTVRLDSSSETVEVVGEQEQLEYFAEQMWKGQIQRATKWVKNKANKRLVQSAFLLQALSMKGCGEQETFQLEPEDQRHQFLFTACVFVILACMNWIYVSWHDIQSWVRTRKRKRQMGRTEEGSNLEAGEPERTKPRLAVLRPVSTTGASSSQDPMPIAPSDLPRGPKFPPPPPTLQPRWAPWSPEWFLYWMAGRVTGRLEREQMSEERRRQYEQRRRILGATLAALELDHSTTVRQRAHEFCFSMTDLSPRDNSPEFLGEGEEALPVDTALAAGDMVGGEDRGYFDPNNIPWRNYGTARNTRDDSEEGDGETSEEDQESVESNDTKVARYLNSRLEEVSDPEMWMALHHWSSESEHEGDETTKNGATATATASAGTAMTTAETTHDDGGEPENEPRTNVE